MSKRLLDHDPFTGVSTFHEYDPSSKVTTISSVQDCTSIIESNKSLQNDGQYKQDGIKNEMWHVATIPVTIIDKWKREDGIDVFNKHHRKAVARKLMDPEWRYLRTSTGRF